MEVWGRQILTGRLIRNHPAMRFNRRKIESERRQVLRLRRGRTFSHSLDPGCVKTPKFNLRLEV